MISRLKEWWLCLAIASLLLAPELVLSFYVPGVAPTDYSQEQKIEVKAIKMTSSHTQLPYEYYSLPFCKPENGIVYKTENLGEILRGDRISTTAYDVEMNVGYDCRVLCGTRDTPSKFDAAASSTVQYRIEQEYFIHLIVDNLPCATQFQMPDTMELQYEPGFRLGFVRDGKTFINNHLKLILSYHETDGVYRVVSANFLNQTQTLSHFLLMFSGWIPSGDGLRGQGQVDDQRRQEDLLDQRLYGLPGGQEKPGYRALFYLQCRLGAVRNPLGFSLGHLLEHGKKQKLENRETELDFHNLG